MSIESKEYYSGRYILYSDGRLYSTTRGIFIKISPDVLGYACCNLYDGKRYTKHRLHRMMAESFLLNDNPLEKIQVNHLDGNKMNYNLNNLEWCTPSENIQHSFDILNRTSPRKLTYEQVTEIINSKLGVLELVTLYGVCEQHIRSLRRGKYLKEYNKEIIEKE